MARKAIAGLMAVEYTSIPVGGGAPTGAATWTKFGDTLEGTCNVDTADPEVSEVNVEESDTPVLSNEKGGSTTLKWTTVNPNETAIVALMGGTYDSENHKWSAPLSIHKSEVAIRFTAKTGHKIMYPRVSVVGKLAGDLTKDGVLGFECTGTVLAPADGTTSPLIIDDSAVV